MKWMNRLLFLFVGGEETMAEIYATLIIRGKKHLSDVPELIKPQVIEILIECGINVDELE